MSLFSESPQFSSGGDPTSSNSSAAQKLASSSAILKEDFMFSANRGSRLFQKEGEMGRSVHDLPIRGIGVGDTENGSWNAEVCNGIPVRDQSDDVEDEDEDDRDDLEEEDGTLEGRNFEKDGNDVDQRNGNSGLHCLSEKICQETPDLLQSQSSFECRRRISSKDGKSEAGMEKQDRANDDGEEPNSISAAESFWTQSSQLEESTAKNQEEASREKRDDLTRGKEISPSTNSVECIRALLSDPITGALMDDAMILFCGHSYGSAGMQHVLRTKYCYKCQHPISEDKMLPNLGLRAAVRAFRREEEIQTSYPSKRKRERSEQFDYGNSLSTDLLKGKRVEFPLAVSDRVIIKGNKRTPERLTGRIAIVTERCLGGWYVVKTIDNGESYKLQYRSLAKVGDDPTSI